jgi:hypothetical protein
MLPQKLKRSALKFHFYKVSGRTWEYLFDHEKENGLAACRVQGFTIRMAWYSTEAVIRWLIERNYYSPEDFQRAPEKKMPSWCTPVAIRQVA